MKLKLFILLALSSWYSLFAQISGNISGKVIDKKTSEPLPYVTIVVKHDATLVTGGITNETGNFEINKLVPQKYTLEIQFIGYKTLIKEVDLSENSRADLGTIAIEEDVAQLAGVEVVKERSIMEQKIDRKVINVGKDLISAGATAGEIMNNIPSVSVDPQTNQITLRGNSNVRILIDGKPTNLSPEQILKQIPSASIKQIELITNPSAKYNPEGMSGIINIVLHKNANDGFNGSVNSGVTFGITPKVNSSLDLNYKTGKVNFYGNYGFNHGKNANNGYINSFETNNRNRQGFDFNNKNTSHLFKVGMDYFIDEKNTVSFYTTQNLFYGGAIGRTDVNYEDPATDDILQLFNSKNDNTSQAYNLDYKHNFKKEGENIELEVNFNKNDSPERTTFEFPLIPSYTLNTVDNTNDNVIINLDYVNPLSETTKLETGLETRIESTDNLLHVNNSYNSSFNYERKIYSAYATYGKQWKKWSAQAGARLEKFEAAADFNQVGNASAHFSDSFVTVYPSGFISYNPNDNNSFNFSVARRVDRASIQQVNPIREWSTPTIDSKGNPDLKPQFTNSFELNYTRRTKIGSITSGVFYRKIYDEINRYIYESPTDPNKNILSYDNFKDNDAYGMEVSGNLNFTKWWSANFGVDAYFRKIRGVVSTDFVEADATIFNARINNSFKATKDLRFQLFGMYRGEDISLQFIRKPMWRTDLGASYTVLGGKGTISARFSDIFKAMKFSFDGDLPYPQSGAFHWESQTVYVGFNYRFGGGKNRALQRKERDNNQTQKSGGLL
ncbi:TonB-dependent receptor domain-containing protein [Flavobacterium sp. NRK F7]|uniref:TonB-dependent receptor domain-containing protein n=1 Tax=Flavobacterium sp. NRK F7 TaxID=2954930 RepID=UPI002090FE5F|nr:TonB-dependent receptor [Flavobacterium sp. NRK F7]MCO6164124.1 TonB-dependent receptor [Flavobacterium sp. NRK F7]